MSVVVTVEDVRRAVEPIARKYANGALDYTATQQAGVYLRRSKLVDGKWYYAGRLVEDDGPDFKRIVLGIAAACVMPSGVVVGGIRFQFK